MKHIRSHLKNGSSQRWLNYLGIFLCLGQVGLGFAGGRAVGNGAGRVEQNIVFAYVSLVKEIDHCLALTSYCSLDGKDSAVLKQIRAIAVSYPFDNRRLQFVSEQANPGFFDTDLGQAHRIAKTGTVPGAAVAAPGDIVYWNSDMFYDDKGAPQLDYPFIMAIWVHEIGHQAGEPDHQYLDGLGAKLRNLLSDQLHDDVYPEQTINGAKIDLTLTTIRYSATVSTTDLMLFDGVSAVSLNRYLDQSAPCASQTETRLGWTLNSASYGGRAKVASDLIATVEYSGWLTVRCLKDGLLLEEDRYPDFLIELSPKNGEYNFKDLQVLPSQR